MKKIFYYTDVLPFLTREQEAIEKLKKNLDIFQENSENIRVIWHPMTGTVECLEFNKSVILEDYKKVVKEFVESGWGDYDTTESYTDVKELMMTCSGYYGDISNFSYDAQFAKIPVMIQNVGI
ncbi:hypothetical protein [Butyrivibrio sp. VCB2001]|uniref:hypothetical protein n=1 Tax=Butyrivibrio sp. VCB2001 TaxID=1280667 RepID=UPI0003FD23E8|nr:hypothetical protein [Butyrivibrio sp. VCB2001]